MVSVQRQILFRVAGRKCIGWRAGLQGLLDQFGPDLDDHGLMVHLRAIFLPDLQCTFRGKSYADVFNDPQRGLVDFFNIICGKDIQMQFGIRDGFDLLGHAILPLWYWRAALPETRLKFRRHREMFTRSNCQEIPSRLLARLTAPMASSE